MDKSDREDFEIVLIQAFHGIFPWENPMFPPTLENARSLVQAELEQAQQLANKAASKTELDKFSAKCRSWLRVHDSLKSNK